MTKNVLMVRIKQDPGREVMNLIAADYQGGRHYAEQLSGGIGGIKAILAQNKIDRIVLAVEGEEYYKEDLEKDIRKYSEAEEDASIEAELLSYVGEERARELEKFPLDMSPKEYVESNLSVAEISYLKHIKYKNLPARSKMQCREDNKNIGIESFIIDETEKDSVIQEKLLNMISQAIENASEEFTNLYVFNSAPEFAGDYVWISLLKLASHQLGTAAVRGIYNVEYDEKKEDLVLLDRTSEYEITTLAEAMNAFSDYGRVDKLLTFMQGLEVKDDTLESLIYAMKYVDAGITLCDIEDIIEGINRIKAIATAEHEFNSARAELFYGIMMYSLKKSYGKLMDGDKIDPFELAKWSYDRGMHQQALTVIESKIPKDMVERGIYYYYDETSDEDDLIEKFAVEQSKLRSYEMYKMDDLDHYYVKTYPREVAPRLPKAERTTKELQHINAEFSVSLVGTEDEAVIKAFTKCTSLDDLTEAFFSYNYIGKLRNSINHAEEDKSRDIDLSGDETKDTERMSTVREALDYFFEKYSLLREQVAQHDYIKREVPRSAVDARAKEIKNSRNNSNNKK